MIHRNDSIVATGPFAANDRRPWGSRRRWLTLSPEPTAVDMPDGRNQAKLSESEVTGMRK